MILAEVVRSGLVESRHHGSVVVLDAAGAEVASAGDVTGPVFPRSAVKPLQAAALLDAGYAPADAAELALVCASHAAEPFHVAGVRAVLRRAGLTEAALGCPPELPLGERERAAVLRAGGGPARVLMNCSGKHAGMLATCVANGWPVGSYLDPGHPVQRVLRAAMPGPVAASGVDGCGAPVHTQSLTDLAAAFLALVTAEPGSSRRRVADAMRAHPQWVAGTGQDDTVLMAGVPGLLSKIGAEGVWAAAVPGAGAVALKIADGAVRARPPVLASALGRLGVVVPDLPVPVLGGGRPVGEVRAAW